MMLVVVVGDSISMLGPPQTYITIEHSKPVLEHYTDVLKCTQPMCLYNGPRTVNINTSHVQRQHCNRYWMVGIRVTKRYFVLRYLIYTLYAVMTIGVQQVNDFLVKHYTSIK